jgi:membrane-associated protease RseP (regulator of RpoE activity)
LELAVRLAILPALVTLHLGAIALTALLLGCRLYEVRLGIGPRLLSWTVGGTRFGVRAFLLAGSTRFDPDDDWDSSTSRQPPGRSFADLSRPARALIYGSGSLALFGLGALLLGPTEATGSVLRGLRQLPAGAVDPLSEGAAHLSALRSLVARAPLSAFVGVVACKVAAFNLLPLPPLNGFHVLNTLLWSDRPIGAGHVWAMNLGALCVLLMLCSYAVAAFSLLLWRA